MTDVKEYVLWVDEGNGWYAHSRYATEEEAEKASEKFDYGNVYSYIGLE